MTRWLVVGANGMLGHDVVTALSGRDITAVDRDEIDITDAGSVERVLPGHDVVVNCAAYTAVDAAETDEAAAFAVNAVGAARLAEVCARYDTRLLHLSTDYVFGGDASSPYPVDAPMDPRSAYGRTKAAGEWAVRAILPDRSWIVRTAWLYGEHGPNFVSTMIRLAAERPTVDVVNDQRGQPTWSRDLADRLVTMVDRDVPAGTYHGTTAGETTWFDLARRVFDLIGEDPERVRPCGSDAFPRPAARPAYSVLDHRCWVTLGLTALRPWQDALAEAAPRLTPVSGR